MLSIDFNSTIIGRSDRRVILKNEIVFKDGDLSVMEISVDGYDSNQINFSIYEEDSGRYGYVQLSVAEWNELKDFIDKNISQITNN